MQTVLVVDDDLLIANAIAITLRQEGYRVVVAATGRDALEAVRRDEPDCIILDLRLPDIGGVEVCRRLRQSSAAPVMFLTAVREESERVAALGAGANDYLTKPIGTAAVVSRVRGLLLAASGEGGPAEVPAPQVYTVGKVRLDVGAGQVTAGGKAAQLSPKETRLLEALLQQPGQVVRQIDLLERVWGAGTTDEHVLDLFIRGLRNKIEPEPDRPTYIRTVEGVGYRFVAP